MSKIARGFVQAVIDRGEGDKAYAIVGIGVNILNRNGFTETQVMEFQVRGEQLKKGLHNAYRQYVGAEVFAPFTDEIDTYYKDNPRIRYSLTGVPLRLADQAPKQGQGPSVTPAAVPTQKAAGGN